MPIVMEKAVQCVGVVCLRGDEVLLIKRGKPPREGEWSIPGGRIEYGETQINAARREVMEETSVKIGVLEKVELVKACFDGTDYDLHDYAARWISGEPVAGDDAADARFFSLTQIDAMGLWPKTTEIIHRAHTMLNN